MLRGKGETALAAEIVQERRRKASNQPSGGLLGSTCCRSASTVSRDIDGWLLLSIAGERPGNADPRPGWRARCGPFREMVCGKTCNASKRNSRWPASTADPPSSFFPNYLAATHTLKG